MIDEKKRAYHFEAASLLQLKSVLREAEKISPPCVRNEQKDINEELALKLIASMRKNYRKAMSLRGAFVATKQSPLNLEIAPGSCSPNDKKVEP